MLTLTLIFVCEALERVLGAYVKDLDQQSLRLAVWKGEALIYDRRHTGRHIAPLSGLVVATQVTLDGLQLKEDAFAALGLPVRCDWAGPHMAWTCSVGSGMG